MTNTSFTTTTKVFHWLTALLILTIIPLGVIAGRLPVETDAQISQKAFLFSLHKTLGIAVFFVALARIVYATTQTKLGPLHPERRFETFFAEIVHWLLYISLVLVPLTGWIHHASAAVAAPVWIPFANSLPFVPKDPTVSDVFGGLHWIWSKIMAASILLHIAGALKHHFADRDITLKRMWFGATDSPAVPHVRSLLPVAAASAIYLGIAGLGTFVGIYNHTTTQTTSLELPATPSEWAVQDGEIGLSITQFGNRISGEFSNWTSVIEFNESAAPVAGNVITTIDISSLTLGTLSAQAMGADFFDQSSFPKAVFAGNILNEDGNYRADGTLTIKGVTVPLTFPFSLEIDGNFATMTSQLTIDRSLFGIGASVTDQSNLENKVDITLSLSATR